MCKIKAEGLTHSYISEDRITLSLSDVSFRVDKGDFVAVLGHNGCGKTTLARHINALIPLQEGRLFVAGLDASNQACIREIRKNCQMVFQNPDNQFVSSLISEDIAFGMRNFGTDESLIPSKVTEALHIVGMDGYENCSPHSLSGGQKQLIALAGILALNPDIIIFDEVTSMLDPESREKILAIIESLHSQGQTIIMISHLVEEAVNADKVILMNKGKIIGQGSPSEILTDAMLLAEASLTPPIPVKAYYDLKKAGIVLPECPLTTRQLAEEICQLH